MDREKYFAQDDNDAIEKLVVFAQMINIRPKIERSGDAVGVPGTIQYRPVFHLHALIVSYMKLV